MAMDDNRVLTTIVLASAITVFGIHALQYIAQVMIPKVEEVEYPEPYGILYLAPAGHIMNVDYGPGDEPVYFGEAMPGTLNSEAGWRIYRYEYETIEGDLEVVGVRFASGNTSFDKVWDDREEYEYS